MKLAAMAGVFGVACFPVFTIAAPPSYGITDLGLGTGVASIGNNNQVVGGDSAGDTIIFHPNGTLTDLSILIQDSPICFGPAYNAPGGASSNNNGTEIVITVVNEQGPRGQCGLTYKNNVLSVAGYYIEGDIVAVNDSGQIIGNDQPDGFGPNCNFDSGGYITAEAINDSAQIVGFNNETSTNELCTNGNWQVLPSLPGATYSTVAAINREAVVVGTASINGNLHGYYTSAKGSARDLGINTQLSDINAVNQSVGSYTTGNLHSFVREDGVTYDLNTSVNSTDPLQPFVTFADSYPRINDNGVIAVVGTDSRTGLSHVYLLKPM